MTATYRLRLARAVDKSDPTNRIGINVPDNSGQSILAAAIEPGLERKLLYLVEGSR